MAKLSIEFLGSGTSVGVPAIACECAVCASTDPRNKRLRSSVLIRGNDEYTGSATTVVIDTTPDFRTQMLRANVRRLDALIVSHYHADHVAGIDDVRRFNHVQHAEIDCWATLATLESLQHSFGYVFSNERGLKIGLPALRPRTIEIPSPFDIGCLHFEPLELDHHVIKNVGLRISCAGSAVAAYCLDVKRISAESYERLKGVDTLILDMLREKEHLTHMNMAEALEAVRIVNPRRAYFSHLAHEVDHQTVEARLPEHIRLAYDGLKLEWE